MSTYQCERCGAIENSALGHYHSIGWYELWPEEYIDIKLCSECGPPIYKSGKPNPKFGKWHGQFEKVVFPLGTMYTDDEGNARRKDNNKYWWEKD